METLFNSAGDDLSNEAGMRRGVNVTCPRKNECCTRYRPGRDLLLADCEFINPGCNTDLTGAQVESIRDARSMLGDGFLRDLKH